MERKFQEELDSLKRLLLSMGAKVEENIGDAIQALIERDQSLSEEILTRDPEIDLIEIQIDEQCISMLALRQPVARDLRFIATAFKIVKDLERVGDMAVDISERAIELGKFPPIKPYVDLPIMAKAAQEMLKGALDSFVRLDADRAREITIQDDKVDELHDLIFNELVELMVADKSIAEPAMHLLNVNKYLERIGDHRCNIAEMVVFMVQGKDIRHLQNIKKLTRS